MTIGFVNVATPTFGNAGGVTSVTSAAFTPSAGGCLLISGGIFLNQIQVITFTDTQGPAIVNLNPPGNVGDSSNDSWQIAYQLNAVASSQTVTMTSNSASNAGFWSHILQYSGVASVSGDWNDTVSPGTGAGGVKGIATVVPLGSVLVAYATDAFNSTGSATITSLVSGGVTPTPRSVAVSSSFEGGYNWSEWAGTGSTVTPTFTTSINEEHVVFQFLLTPAITNSATIAWVS